MTSADRDLGGSPRRYALRQRGGLLLTMLAMLAIRLAAVPQLEAADEPVRLAEAGNRL